MSKTRIVSTEYLMELWNMAITELFFPEWLFDELKPIDALNSLGDSLPAMREKYRLSVDEFIESLLDGDDHEEFWESLRKVDPMIMALYCDRLNTATVAVKNMRSAKEEIVIPDSWPTVVAALLFQRPLQ